MSLSGRATGRALPPDKRTGGAQIDLIQDPRVDARHRRRRHAHRQSRQLVFDTVHALNEEGLSYSEIARSTGYGRRSIAKWLTFETAPDRQKAALKPTFPLYFVALLAQCWRNGNRCGQHLFHDLKQRGYTGSFSNLERLLASLRRPERSVKDSASPAPVLGMRFRGIFRSGDPGKLNNWIDDAAISGLVAIARFARVLHRDLDAVCSAIELSWSNGQAEGQINRLKTIKREMYGRAGPELLRARMLPLDQNYRHKWGRTQLNAKRHRWRTRPSRGPHAGRRDKGCPHTDPRTDRRPRRLEISAAHQYAAAWSVGRRPAQSPRPRLRLRLACSILGCGWHGRGYHGSGC